MKDRLRVGIVGIGFGQKVLVPAFAANPRCEVVGICASSLDRAERVAARLELPRAYGHWEQLVSDPDIDAVAIATPPSARSPIALAALANGKHVFCEKPLASNLPDAEKIVDAARKSGKAHMMDFEFPEIESFQRAKAILDSGKLGPLTHAVVSWHVESYAARMGIRSWKTDITMGGGTLYSFVSHTFYYLDRLIGPILRMGAHLVQPVGGPEKQFGDTMALLWLEHQNGVPSSVCVSSNAFLGTGHKIAIYGQEGSLILDNPSRDYISGFSLWHGTRDTDRLDCVHREPADPETDGRIAAVSGIVKRFVVWALDGVPGKPDLEDGFRVQRLLDAAHKATFAGQGIELQ